VGNWSETQNVNELSIVVYFGFPWVTLITLVTLVFFGVLWFSLVFFGLLWFTLVASKLLPNSHSPLTGSWHFAS